LWQQSDQPMNDTLRIHACSKTDRGLQRPQNEDVCAADAARHAYLVADGMGGDAGGEVASSLFLLAVDETFPPGNTLTESTGRTLVKAAFSLANEKILAHAAITPEHKGLGCTAELLLLCRDGIILGHVGDSRTYCFHGGRLEQLTIDHSMVQEQVALGLLTQREARYSKFRNVLTRAVGITDQLVIDISSHKVQAGDIYLLCTDGLHGMVDDEELLSILAFDAPLSLKAEMLINMANDAGGKDNISVTLLEILN